eukprot:4565237-Prymnesium_polylepis.1
MDFETAIENAQTDGQPDVVHAAVTEALKVEYRAKVATSLHAKGSAIVASLPSSLCFVMLTWKSLFPESSLWTLGVIAFPILKVLTSIPSLGLYNQLFSNWKFVFFCFFASTSYWYFLFAAPAFQKNRGRDPSPAFEEFGYWKKRVHYPWLICEIVFLVAFLWPLFELAGDVIRNGQADKAGEDYLARYVAHHWATLIWDIIEVRGCSRPLLCIRACVCACAHCSARGTRFVYTLVLNYKGECLLAQRADASQTQM